MSDKKEKEKEEKKEEKKEKEEKKKKEEKKEEKKEKEKEEKEGKKEKKEEKKEEKEEKESKKKKKEEKKDLKEHKEKEKKEKKDHKQKKDKDEKEKKEPKEKKDKDEKEKKEHKEEKVKDDKKEEKKDLKEKKEKKEEKKEEKEKEKKDKEKKGKEEKKEERKEHKEKKEKEKEEKKEEKEKEKKERREEKEKQKEKKEKEKKGHKEGEMEKEGDHDEEGGKHGNNKGKAWKKNTAISADTMGRQRTLEMFLLSFSMKRLRGTSWLYYDIVCDPNSEGDIAPEDQKDADRSLDVKNKEENEKKTSESDEEGPSGGRPESGYYTDSEGGSKAHTRKSGILNSIASVAGEGLFNQVHSLPKEDLKDYDAVLFLPSGGLRPEAHFQEILRLAEEGYRVLVPLFPDPLTEFEDYAAGVILVLKNEQVSKVHIFGVGLGAMVGQYMLSKPHYAEYVKSAALVHLLPPSEEWTVRLEKVLKKSDFHTPFVTSALIGYKASSKDVEAIPSIPSDRKELWLVWLRRIQATKEAVSSRVLALFNASEKLTFVQTDFEKYQGPVLLLQAAKGVGGGALLPFESEGYEEGKICFPNATLQKVGAGPLYFVVEGDLVAGRVVDFLAEHFGVPPQQRKKGKNTPRLSL